MQKPGARELDQLRINDLAITGLETPGPQVYLKNLKELLDNSSTAQSLSGEGDCGGVWNVDHHAKPGKLLKGASVIHLIFKVVNRKWMATTTLRLKNCWRTSILKGAADNPLAPYIALALLRRALVKKCAE